LHLQRNVQVEISPEEMPLPTGNFVPSPALPTDSTITTKNTQQFQIMLYGTTITGKTPGQGVRADHFSDMFCCRADACIGIYHAKRMHPPPNEEEFEDPMSDDDSEEDDEAKKRKRPEGNVYLHLTDRVFLPWTQALAV